MPATPRNHQDQTFNDESAAFVAASEEERLGIGGSADDMSDDAYLDEEASVDADPADGLATASTANAGGTKPGALGAAATQSSLEHYARVVRAIKPIDAAEEAHLVAMAQSGDVAARHRLIECHLGVVIAVARGYAPFKMPVEDLIEEGNLGLMEAVDRFDPLRGVRFASYARWWIREAINHAMTTQSRTVRLPAHIVRGISSVRSSQRKIEGGDGRPSPAPALEATRSNAAAHPTQQGLAQIAHATGRSTASVSQLMTLSQAPLSLNASSDGSAESTMQDGLAADGACEPDAALMSKEVLATVLGLVDRLPRVERAIVIQRFGFGNSEPRTLEDIGAAINLTAERVRQLQNRALGRMRDMLANRGIDFIQFL